MIVFCEYVIPERHREAYMAWVHSEPERWMEVQIAENTAQPGVFVEIQRVGTEEEAVKREKERREGRSWIEMEQWVKGGKEGLRIWTFRPIRINV